MWQAHYQIFAMTLLKEFIELNVNSDAMIKNVEHVELNISIEDLEKHFNEENDEEYFPEADVPLLEKLHDFIMIHYFYEKE